MVVEQYLASDVSIDCDSEEYHSKVKTLAVISMFVYCFGLFAVFGLLLFLARKSILAKEKTPLALALHFLYHEYKPQAFYWDLVEMFRRLILVGVFVLIRPGSIMQSVTATIFCMLYQLLQIQLAPFEDSADDKIAGLSSFAMLIFFFACILFSITEFMEHEQLQEVISPEQIRNFWLPSGFLTVAIIICVVSAFIVCIFMLVLQLRNERLRLQRDARAARARRLRHKRETKEEVIAPEIPYDHFHIFLSHVWGHGQEKMRIIKTRLIEMMPDLCVFLGKCRSPKSTMICRTSSRCTHSHKRTPVMSEGVGLIPSTKIIARLLFALTAL